jgi:hypothetical protein
LHHDADGCTNENNMNTDYSPMNEMLMFAVCKVSSITVVWIEVGATKISFPFREQNVRKRDTLWRFKKKRTVDLVLQSVASGGELAVASGSGDKCREDGLQGQPSKVKLEGRLGIC